MTISWKFVHVLSNMLFMAYHESRYIDTVSFVRQVLAQFSGKVLFFAVIC